MKKLSNTKSNIDLNAENNFANLSAIKILVTGAFNSGKTHFIKTISNNFMLNTEKNVSDPHIKSKKLTTVAMDFAKTKLENTPDLFFFGTPGQKRFDFMWEILSFKMLGCIIMVDSYQFHESKEETQEILNYFLNLPYSVPLIIAANKQDLPQALTPDEIRQELSLSKKISILPCIATQKEKVKEISMYLINNILGQRKNN